MEPPVEVRVHSWLELIEALYAGSWREDIQRYRSPFVFRGATDAAYPLVTGLSRLGSGFERLESHLLRNFRKYARHSMVEIDTLWHWLSMAQHHGLPTRLLDWTISPLVAAHFSTEDIQSFDRNGCIWMVNAEQAHHLLPDTFRSALEEEGATFFTVEMLDRLAASLEDLDDLAEEPFVLFFEPPSIDARIVNQYALFSLMSSSSAQIDGWLQRHPHLWRKIILPAEIKWEVRDKLDQANVTERVLFPGLDGLSRWQKRYYTPRVPLRKE